MQEHKNRGWLLTIKREDISVEELEVALENYSFSVFQIEKGEETGYEHYQLYIEHENQIKFSTLKNKFPTAHIEARRGTKKQAYDYCTKEDTRIEGFWQQGVIDLEEKQGKRNDIETAKALIYEGHSVDYIVENHPSLARNLQFLNVARQAFLKSEYGNKLRNLEVTYIYGKAGTGKTSYVYKQYNFSDVYRVTDYEHPFDFYDGQEVIVLEEFRSGFKISELLNILDIYPTVLKSRYVNKIACYTKVFILSNLSPAEQYPDIQITSPDSFKAFLRRVHKIYYCNHGGIMEERKVINNISPFEMVTVDKYEQIMLPFEA